MKNIKQFHTDSEYYSKYDYSELPDKKKNGVSWPEVVQYREKYKFELPLLDDKKRHVSITQTPWILQKEIRLISSFSQVQAAMLVELSSKYSSATLLLDISLKSIVNEMHWILNDNGKAKNKVSRTVIENLVNKTDEPKDEDEKKILKMFNLFESITEKLTLPREIAKMFFNINGIDEEKFGDINASMVDTIKSDKINSLLTKISALIYAVLGNNMYGDKSYEIMVLSLISLSRNSYKGEILKGVSFFKTLEFFKSDLNRVLESVKHHNSDLTFLTIKMAEILLYSLRISSEQIEIHIKDEERYNSLTTKDKNKSYKAILSSHPYLSVKQAKFYVNHCDIKINYTLKDFQEYFGTSYETSRYSLDKLVDAGFYKKKKIGKKYIYNAIRQK